MSMKLYGADHLLKQRSTLVVINTIAGLLLLTAVLLFVRDALSLAVSRRGAGPVAEKALQPPPRHQLRDYEALMKNNPFGFPAGELTPLSAASGPSISQTDLSLIGTIAGKKSQSYAIFADKSGKQDIFKIGENVFGLGTLGKVEKDSVVIRSKGRDITLPFTDIAVVKDADIAASSPVPFGRRTGGTSYVIDQQQVQQALSRPDQLMTDARFIPNIADGRQKGFLVREIKPGGIYQNLGLQNGDILLRINDYTMSSPDTALQAITSLKGIDRAEIDIIRRGSPLTMTYQIR